MAKINYIEYSGEERVLEVEPGQSVMQAAVAEGIPGIIGECAGNMSCATCHVYVDEAWLERTGSRGETETLLLEEVCDPRPNSRLSCQIKVSESLDGLVVRLPARQI